MKLLSILNEWNHFALRFNTDPEYAAKIMRDVAYKAMFSFSLAAIGMGINAAYGVYNRVRSDEKLMGDIRSAGNWVKSKVKR